MVDVINALKSDKKVYVIAAPATEGQFGANITMGSWKKAMQEVGFNGFIEAGLGGDMTAASEAAEWVEACKAGREESNFLLSGICQYGASALPGDGR